MDLGLDEIVGGATPPDLSEKIAVAARGLAIAPPPRRPSRLAASILIAASLLVGAFVLWKILSTPERPPAPPRPASAQEGPRAKVPSAPESGALQRLAAEMENDSRVGDPDPRRRAEALLQDGQACALLTAERFGRDEQKQRLFTASDVAERRWFARDNGVEGSLEARRIVNEPAHATRDGATAT